MEETEHAIALLVADDDAGLRSAVKASARSVLNDVVVLEAEDGAEAIQLGLQQRPELALLDVDMPRLGGIEAAVVLRELLPHLRLALYSGDPDAHRDRAHGLGLPLFDKSDLSHPTQWLSARAALPPRKLSLACATCGYGVYRSAPPRRCPMCQGDEWHAIRLQCNLIA